MQVVKQARVIEIFTARNGYIVSVGCQTLVFNSRDEMLQRAAEYLAEPEAMEKQLFADIEAAGGDRNYMPLASSWNETLRRPVPYEGGQALANPVPASAADSPREEITRRR